MFKSITMEIFSKDCDEKNDDLNERRLGPIDFTIKLSIVAIEDNHDKYCLHQHFLFQDLPVYLTTLSEASCATAHY